MSEEETCRKFLETLAGPYRIRTVKVYRIPNCAPSGIPVIPCLDHEAKLHAKVPAHLSAYIEEASSGELHEVCCYPARLKLMVDTVSTHLQHGSESHERLCRFLAEGFPGAHVEVSGPSLLRGDRRVAEAARAQLTLRDVLVGEDLEQKAALQKLKAVASLMEKESRVASWSVRTVFTPVIAVATFLAFLLLQDFRSSLGDVWADVLGYGMVALLGGVLLYLGLKAVHLTEMSNRVWKRATEYELILAERTRFHQG